MSLVCSRAILIGTTDVPQDTRVPLLLKITCCARSSCSNVHEILLNTVVRLFNGSIIGCLFLPQ